MTLKSVVMFNNYFAITNYLIHALSIFQIFFFFFIGKNNFIETRLPHENSHKVA